MAMFKLNHLRGSTNVITGAGSGLGAATVRWFLKKDCGPILAIDRQFSPQYIESINLDKELTDRVTLEKCDTFDEKLETPLSNFVQKHGPIDNLLNIAGIAGAFLLYPKATGKIYAKENSDILVEFNTVGTFNVSRLVAKFMIDDYFKITNKNLRSRCIINAGCFSTTNPTLGQNFYAGTKASIDSMTLCFARELSTYNIRCNTISVGYFDTPLVKFAGDLVNTYINKISLCPKRLGRPNEFAHLAEALIQNEMMNGACIKLDGGTRVPTNW